MSCSTPSDQRAQVQLNELTKRIRYMETALAGFQELTGFCAPTGGWITAVYAIAYDSGTGVYTITFASADGDIFEVQSSLDDGVTWATAENGVTAAVSPATQTVWVSEAYDLGDPARIFRVRRYPHVSLPCAPPSPAICPDIIP